MSRINLLTDAPKHNLALMKISAYHKAQGDTVVLNQPIDQGCDLSFGSYLFRQRDYADVVGGPGVDPRIRLDDKYDKMRPDYELYPDLDYSLGFTWENCPRRCKFCCVPKQQPPKVHRSIWEFHDPRFKKICLLNNNTFSDPRWRETFEEIWEAGLTVIDHGYDARLLDDEKAEALKRTRFEGLIHFAWDRMGDESKVLRGLRIARDYGLHARSMVYVLVGFDTSIDQDIYRCQKIHDLDFDPFVMIYNEKSRPRSQFRRQAHLRRCINRWRGYRRYGSIQEAWEDYKG